MPRNKQLKVTVTRAPAAKPAPRSKPKPAAPKKKATAKPKTKMPGGLTRSEVERMITAAIRPDTSEVTKMPTINPTPIHPVKTKTVLALKPSQEEVDAGLETIVLQSSDPSAGLLVKGLPSDTMDDLEAKSAARMALGRKPIHRKVQFRFNGRRKVLATFDPSFSASNTLIAGFSGKGHSFYTNGVGGTDYAYGDTQRGGILNKPSSAGNPIFSSSLYSAITGDNPVLVLQNSESQIFAGGSGNGASYTYTGVTSIAAEMTITTNGTMVPANPSLLVQHLAAGVWATDANGSDWIQDATSSKTWRGTVSATGLNPATPYRVLYQGQSLANSSAINITNVGLTVVAADDDDVFTAIQPPDHDLLQHLAPSYRLHSSYLEAKYLGSNLENGGRIVTGAVPPEAAQSTRAAVPTGDQILEWPASNESRLSKVHGVSSVPYGPAQDQLVAFGDYESDSFDQFPMPVMALKYDSPQTTSLVSTTLVETSGNSQTIPPTMANVNPDLKMVSDAILGVAANRLRSTNALAERPTSVIRKLTDAVMKGLSGNVATAMNDIADTLF